MQPKDCVKKQTYKQSIMWILSVLLTLSALPILSSANEKTEHTFQRTANSDTTLSVTLSQDVYRTESYEDTYIESVPYQETEWYTDYETYYEDKEVCENVPVNDRVCRDVERCADVPVTDRVCRNERQCRSVPVRDCERREECRDTPGGRRCRPVNDCTTRHEEQCDTVPVCRERTRYERQCHTRPVCEDRTRYEYRCRTEVVERRRPVERQRTVTKYRDEVRCCVTRYRDVYDRTWTLPVEVVFPQESVLLPGESESVRVTLQGPESAPSAQVRVRSDIFNYEIVRSGIEGRAYRAHMQIKPHLTESELGASSISSLKLLFNREGAARVEFFDKSVKTRVNSEYIIQVLDHETGQLVAEKVMPAQGDDHIVMSLSEALEPNRDYVFVLTVNREGVVLVDPVNFNIEGAYEYVRLDPDYFGPDSVLTPRVKRMDDQVLMYIKDSGLADNVNTSYLITLTDKQSGVVLALEEVRPEDLVVDEKLGLIWAVELDNLYQVDVDWVLSASRTSLFLEEDISFEKSGTNYFHIDLEPYKLEHNLKDLSIEGIQQDTVISFVDDTEVRDALDTKYIIEVWYKGFFVGHKDIASGEFMRSSLLESGDGRIISLPINLGFEVDDSNLKRYLQRGRKVHVRVRVERYDLREGREVFKEFSVKNGERL